MYLKIIFKKGSKVLKELSKILIGMGALILPIAAVADGERYNSSLELELTGAWLAGDGVDTDYAINRTDINSINFFNPMPTGDFENVDSNYRTGGGVALKYQSNCCFNMGVSYFRVHRKSFAEVTTATPDTPIIGPILLPPSVGDGFATAVTAASEFSFDYIFSNFELGSLICVLSDCLTVNPKIGLSVGRFKDHQFISYVGLFEPNAIIPAANDQVDMFSRYRGFGPSIGTDISYLFCRNFSLFGNFRYSTLLGTLHGTLENTATDATGAVIPVNTGTIHFRTNNNVVKLFQSELGLGYFYGGACHCIEIKAGYMYTQAVDAINRIQFPDDTASSVDIKQIVNASYHGPFIRVSTRFGL